MFQFVECTMYMETILIYQLRFTFSQPVISRTRWHSNIERKRQTMIKFAYLCVRNRITSRILYNDCKHILPRLTPLPKKMKSNVNRKISYDSNAKIYLKKKQENLGKDQMQRFWPVQLFDFFTIIRISLIAIIVINHPRVSSSDIQ